MCDGERPRLAEADLTRAREEAGALREALGDNDQTLRGMLDEHVALGQHESGEIEYCSGDGCSAALNRLDKNTTLLSGSTSTETSPAREGETALQTCSRCGEPNGGHGHACHHAVEDRGQKWCPECNRPAPESAPQEETQ